jgi:chemotaxis protein histidine kinase CheA
MNDNPNSEENLTDEFRSLGQNLLETLHAAWERPERKKLQQELEDGLSELVNTLKTEADTFASSSTAQKVKTEAEDLRQRVQTGEVDTAIRSELLKVLQTVNAELKKAANRLGGDQD